MDDRARLLGRGFEESLIQRGDVCGLGNLQVRADTGLLGSRKHCGRRRGIAGQGLPEESQRGHCVHEPPLSGLHRCHVLDFGQGGVGIDQRVVRSGIDGCPTGCLHQDLGGLTEPSTEVGLEDLEGEHVRRVGGKEVGEREASLELGESPPPQAAQDQGDDEGRNRGVLGDDGQLLHCLGQEPVTVLVHGRHRETSLPIRPSVGDHPDRRQEDQHQQEGGEDADRGEDPEVLEGRDRAEHIGEEPDHSGQGGEHECDPDGLDGGGGRVVDRGALTDLLPVSGDEVDPVVDPETDEEDGHDLSRCGEGVDDPRLLQEHTDPLHPDDRHQDRQQGHAGVGQGAADRASPPELVGLDPVDEDQDQQDHGECQAEELAHLGGEVVGPGEEQCEGEGKDFVFALDRFEVCGHRRLGFDLGIEGLLGPPCRRAHEREHHPCLGGPATRVQVPRCQLRQERSLLRRGVELAIPIEGLDIDRLHLLIGELGGIETLSRRRLLDTAQVVEHAGTLGTVGDQVARLGAPDRLCDRHGGPKSLGRDDVTTLVPDQHLDRGVGGGVAEQLGYPLPGGDLGRVGGEALVPAGDHDLSRVVPEDPGQEQ